MSLHALLHFSMILIPEGYFKVDINTNFRSYLRSLSESVQIDGGVPNFRVGGVLD